MLFKLAMGNVRKKFRSYLSYFLSAAFSVFVIYLFMSIFFSCQVRSAMQQAMGESDYHVAMTLFTIAAWLVGLFSAFFIWYANSLFIKTRKKEFATYMLLGLSKRQTILMNFFENALLFVLAFLTGLGAGALLGKLMTMVLFRIVGLSGPVHMELSVQALRVCTVVYAGIFALISLHGAAALSRNTLLNLLAAGRRAERALKVSAWTWLLAICSLAIFAAAYIIAARMAASDWMLAYMLLVIVLVCVATLMLFAGGLSLMIHYGRRDQKRMLRGTRMIWLNQLYFRYQGNVGTLSMIAVATSVALCAVLACTGLYLRSDQKASLTHPFSVEFYQRADAEQAFQSALASHPDVAVKGRADMAVVQVRGVVDGQDESPYYVMPEGDFNRAMALLPKGKAVSVEDGQAVLAGASGTDAAEDNSIALTNLADPMQLIIVRKLPMLYLSYAHFSRTLVVSGATFESIRAAAQPEQLLTITGVQLENGGDAGAFSDALLGAMPRQAKASTLHAHLKEDLGVIGVMFFVGIFIGLTFVAATGSIIHFKMVEEAVQDAGKYRMLRHIGADGGQLRRAVASELAVVFGAPLVVAAANTLAANVPFEQMLSVPMARAYGWVLGAYALCYALFYLLTMHSYMKRIRAA